MESSVANSARMSGIHVTRPVYAGLPIRLRSTWLSWLHTVVTLTAIPLTGTRHGSVLVPPVSVQRVDQIT